MQEKNQVYGMEQREKQRVLTKKLEALSKKHQAACRPYQRLCQGLSSDMPFVPVSAFKEMELCSVPGEEIVKVVTSSGTSGQQVSRICLDAATACLQQESLCRIAGDFLGSKRLPMLIIDSPDVLKDRVKFSARGAGILGFAMLSSCRCFALDEKMHLDLLAVTEFLKAHEGERILIFGFTYMIWSCFYQELSERGMTLDLSRGFLIHGGGWKQMHRLAVSEDIFAKELFRVCGIRHISNYYGMAEQTGSIFMACSRGHLHAGCDSDIVFLDPADFSECPPGKPGIIALSSTLPQSYPGHRILTEDLGILLGTDDCPCGRKGVYFKVLGRIPKTELRGCSDVFANASVQEDEGHSQVTLLAGVLRPKKRKAPVFDPLVLSFLEDVSKQIRKDVRVLKDPDIRAFGFWCRRSHLEQMKQRFLEQKMSGQQKNGRLMRRGRGMVFHMTPSNLPIMFAYSFAAGLLSGNGNILRLSQKKFPQTERLCELLEEVWSRNVYRELRASNSLIRYGYEEDLTRRYSAQADARLLWGSDASVSKIRACAPMNGGSDLVFPDKYSIAVCCGAYIQRLSDEALKQLVYGFYNDTYGADQNACSSPRLVFWISEGLSGEALAKVKRRWWEAVAYQAAEYELDAFKAVGKYQALCRAYLQREGCGPVTQWGNRLYVIPCETLPEHLRELFACCGMFFEYDLRDRSELFSYLDADIQTIVSVGEDPKKLWKEVREAGCLGVDRVVCCGEALQFDLFWDRKDLVELLSEEGS